MNDELILAESNGALREEIKTLKSEMIDLITTNDNLRYKVRCNEWYEGLSGLLITISFIICVGLFLVYPLYMNIMSDQIPTHCQIEKIQATKDNGEIDNEFEPYYKMYGSIPWVKDAYYGRFITLEEAKEFAEMMSCEIKG